MIIKIEISIRLKYVSLPILLFFYTRNYIQNPYFRMSFSIFKEALYASQKSQVNCKVTVFELF